MQDLYETDEVGYVLNSAYNSDVKYIRLWFADIEVTLKVVSVEEGTGRNKGRLGAVLVEGEDDGHEYSLSCGSGFSDIQREEYWSKRNQLIGQLVEIRADAKTKSKDAVAFSLRFPRFKCFRGFKAGEKV